MHQVSRHDLILEYLNHNKLLTVDQAVNIFKASPATIRRDFNYLANIRLADRFRGGIRSTKSSTIGTTFFQLRMVNFSEEKESIAQAAIKLLKPEQTIFIDGGTTTFHLARFLPDFTLRIITNSLRLAAVLDEKRTNISQIEIIITGGMLYPNSGVLLGPNTQKNLSQYHTDWSFISVVGINENGIFNTSELVCEYEKIMIDNADKVVILSDHSKIGKHAMCHVCDLAKIDYLITDAFPDDPELAQRFKDAEVEIITAGKKRDNSPLT